MNNLSKLMLVLLVLTIASAASLIIRAPVMIDWKKIYDVEKYNYGRSIQMVPNDGYIIAGYTGSSDVNHRVLLLKIDESGNMQWNKTYGLRKTNQGLSVQIAPDGGYVITGWTYSSDSRGSDVLLIKTDALGNVQWQKAYGGTANDWGYSVQVTPDGGYVVAGWTSSYGERTEGYMPHNVYLIKTDSSGNLLWQNSYGGKADDFGYSLQVAPDGGYIIAGETSSFGTGSSDVYLVKTDSSGNLQWQRTFGGTGMEGGKSVQVTPDNGYIIVGGTNSPEIGSGDYLVKTDSLGNMQWQKGYVGGDLSAVQLAPDGGYIVTGNTINVSGAGLMKTDSYGNEQWHLSLVGGDSSGYSLIAAPDGGYVTVVTEHSYEKNRFYLNLLKVSVTPRFWVVVFFSSMAISIEVLIILIACAALPLNRINT